MSDRNKATHEFRTLLNHGQILIRSFGEDASYNSIVDDPVEEMNKTISQLNECWEKIRNSIHKEGENEE